MLKPLTMAGELLRKVDEDVQHVLGVTKVKSDSTFDTGARHCIPSSNQDTLRQAARLLSHVHIFDLTFCIVYSLVGFCTYCNTLIVSSLVSLSLSLSCAKSLTNRIGPSLDGNLVAPTNNEYARLGHHTSFFQVVTCQHALLKQDSRTWACSPRCVLQESFLPPASRHAVTLLLSAST
jgi:hypothetical protein